MGQMVCVCEQIFPNWLGLISLQNWVFYEVIHERPDIFWKWYRYWNKMAMFHNKWYYNTFGTKNPKIVLLPSNRYCNMLPYSKDRIKFNDFFHSAAFIVTVLLENRFFLKMILVFHANSASSSNCTLLEFLCTI